MEFNEIIRTRRSVRAYRPDPVPETALRRVLDSARLAPSANNTQPWHYYVVRENNLKRQIAKLACGQMFIAEAPLVIVCCGKRYPDPYSWIGDNMYLVDCAITLDHLTLAARNEGLGTCWIGAFNHEGIKEKLKITAGFDVIMLTPLGYPSDENAFHETRNRRPLESIMTELS